MTGTSEENRAAFVLARVSLYNFILSSAVVQVILDISTLSVLDKIMNVKENYNLKTIVLNETMFE